MADQPRRTLKKQTLRPPSRHLHPSLTAWLADAPSGTAKLTPEDLRQWKLDDEGRRRPGRGLYMAAVALRVLSLVSAFIVAVLGLQMLPAWGQDAWRLIPMIVPGGFIAIWDTLEFVVVCTRKDHRGMPRSVHLPADGLICLLLGASIAGFWVALYDGVYWYTPSFWTYYGPIPSVAQYIAALVFIVILLLIHGTFFFFLLCSRRFRSNHHIPTPRIMYLPGTGEAVVVLARPYPPEPTHQQQRKAPASPIAELDPLPLVDIAADLPSPVSRQPTTTTEDHGTQASMAGPSQPLNLVSESSRRVPPLQAVPPRKPVAGTKSIGTHYATPWPPDHVPDEAELARAARGEAQAQWMTLADSGLGLGGGRVKGDPVRDSEKSDLFRGTEYLPSRKP